MEVRLSSPIRLVRERLLEIPRLPLMEVRFSSPVRLVRTALPKMLRSTPDGSQIVQSRQAGQGSVQLNKKIIPYGGQVVQSRQAGQGSVICNP